MGKYIIFLIKVIMSIQQNLISVPKPFSTCHFSQVYWDIIDDKVHIFKIYSA